MYNVHEIWHLDLIFVANNLNWKVVHAIDWYYQKTLPNLYIPTISTKLTINSYTLVHAWHLYVPLAYCHWQKMHISTSRHKTDQRNTEGWCKFCNCPVCFPLFLGTRSNRRICVLFLRRTLRRIVGFHSFLSVLCSYCQNLL